MKRNLNKIYKIFLMIGNYLYKDVFHRYFKFILFLSCIYNIGFPGGAVFSLVKEIKIYIYRTNLLSELEELKVYMESFNKDLKSGKIHIQTIRDKLQQALNEKKDAKLYILEKKIDNI